MQRLTKWRSGLTLTAVGCAVMTLSGAQAAAQDFEWQGRVAPGRAIEIMNVNGDVEAIAGRGDHVEVTAIKYEGRRGDPEDVTFEVVEHAGGVTICAMYPSRGRRDNECRPGGGGHMSTNDNDTEVRFTVHVPAGVDFVGRSVNGDVDIDGIAGNATAHTVNGSVMVQADGWVEANTVNGSIEAWMGTAEWDDDIEFHTVNGSITVYLPDGVNADVRATTVNGAMETDFPLTVQGRWGPRHLQGRIGSGGQDLRLETVNGGIHLKRR
ncbi:MAG: hypothetical protein PVF27_05845 [Gemmatimonadales bacterium]|jgi:hypothetical protein